MTHQRAKLPMSKRSLVKTGGKHSIGRATDSTQGNVGGSRSKLAKLLAALGVAAVAGCSFLSIAILTGKGSATIFGRDQGSRPLTFVGSDTCAGCHQAEANLWRSSQHSHAMDHATARSVLGDFNDTGFDYNGVHSRFFRKDGKYFVATDGPDGKLAEFEIKYTFGVDPLQQYLIEFPDGRIQALSIAWDTRSKDVGGQHWFHLYPDERIDHNDVLHWTKLNQNWNFMCAECHSTGVHKNYDAQNDRFSTTWAEISVGCEACHGQGSNHVAWARSQRSWWPLEDRSKGLPVRFDERDDVVWQHDPKTGDPKRNWSPAQLRKEVETCGLCHARRAEFSENWVPGRWLSDTHLVSPLSHELYYADGQMRDREEVYNYGPFKQSRMFAAGVTCSDCHDPHSAKLRVSGDSVCLQCHSADRYATSKHSHHEGANARVECASCHMPVRTYMVVDRRHDHSFRVPRPDLSLKLGTPNACNGCHTDKSPEWAAAAVASWSGPNREGFQNYTDAFHAAWTDQVSTKTLLTIVARGGDTPSFIRASALTEFTPFVSPSNISLAESALTDPDPMVRIGALDMLENIAGQQIWPLISPLLTDPVRGVRMRAAVLLADVPTEIQPPADRKHFEQASAEFIAAQQLNADRPEARSALGSFFARRGRIADSEAEYQSALRLSPQYAPAAVNLADLYRQLHRDDDGESVLRAAVFASPAEAGLYYALGLTLTRLKRSDEALTALRRATELQPKNARYAYVLAVALHSRRRVDEAMTILNENNRQHPNDRDTLVALVSFSRDAGDFVEALRYAQQLSAITPGDPNLANLIEELRRHAN